MLVVLISGTIALPSAAQEEGQGAWNRVSHYHFVYQVLNPGEHLSKYTTDNGAEVGVRGTWGWAVVAKNL